MVSWGWQSGGSSDHALVLGYLAARGQCFILVRTARDQVASLHTSWTQCAIASASRCMGGMGT